MQNLSYTNTNQVNAQLLQGMLNASRNQQLVNSMMNNGAPGGGNPMGAPD